jgi:hypothetical protein
MGRRSDRHNRPPRFDIVHDVLHLRIRQIPPAREQHHQIGFVECLEPWDVVVPVGIDRAVFGIDREEHRAIEPLPRQDPGKLRHSLLRPILLIPADQHDSLTLAGSIGTGDGEPVGGRGDGHAQQHYR